MPQFELNAPVRGHSYNDLSEFAQGYVEAMFFTNCDCGSDDEFLANRLGVERLTKDSVTRIDIECATFQNEAKDLLEQASERGYSDEQAGRDFWFSRQGHGVGFWDRDELAEGGLGDKLHALAKAEYGETFVEIYRGWIYYR